jgi:hypothetical protein
MNASMRDAQGAGLDKLKQSVRGLRIIDIAGEVRVKQPRAIS